MLWLGLALGVCVIAVGRWRGALALIGLGASLVLVTQFMVPAIIAGQSPFWVALLGSLAAMFITVALSSGLGAQSLAATLGIAGSLPLASLLALLYAHLAHLNGFTSDLAFTLRQSGATVSLQGLVIAGMVIAAVGVLADMAVSQASAVMALRRANPAQRAGELYRGAFAPAWLLLRRAGTRVQGRRTGSIVLTPACGWPKSAERRRDSRAASFS